MPELTGPTIAPGDLSEVYSRTAIDLGTRVWDDNGNEYIFMNGVASTQVGSWVTYDEEFVTTLLASGASGPIAIAMGAIVAGKYGFYCVVGNNITANAQDGTGDNAILGQSATSGYVGDAFISGNEIYGAISRSSLDADAGSGNILVQIWHPHIGRSAIG
jgi:hypothetical protein